MGANKAFRVAVMADLTDREWQILASATRLTTARARSYVFELPSHVPPDICLVDADLASAHCARSSHSAPTILLKQDAGPPSSRKREFRRPLVPSCLLSLINLLDEVTVQELHFLPELSIGQEGLACDGAMTTVTAAPRPRFSALVVDDSSTVRAQVAIGLKMFGATSDFAETAEEAIELLRTNRYDIAFLDVVLPGADGYQICKAIKKNQQSRQTTVVMLTGKSSTFDRVKASLAGCDAFLTKPVQCDVFQQILKKFLREQEPLDSAQGLVPTR